MTKRTTDTKKSTRKKDMPNFGWNDTIRQMFEEGLIG